MDYKIIAADAAIGQIQVAYSQGGVDVATYAIDVPIVDGAYIVDAALDAEIRARSPVWVVQRKAEAASAVGFEVIAATAQARSPVPLTLEQLKTAKANAINAYREEVLASGVVYNGNQFDSDPLSVTRLTAVATAVSAGAALPQGFAWRSSANVDVPFSAADVVQLLGTMILTADSVFKTSWEKKQAVQTANTQTELDAVSWVDNAVGGGV